VLLRAEDQGDAPAAGEFPGGQRGQIRQRDDRLLGLAVGEGSGAGNKGAVGYCLGKIRAFDRVLEQFGCADGGASFAPVRRVGSGDREAGEPEVGHGARSGAYIEGIARGDENDFDAVELGFCQQGMIVRRPATSA
jgi:hypothetical protein